MNTCGPLAPAAALCRELELIPVGCTVLCAVSGGADSVCLLHWLDALRREHPFTLKAAHYNHNLRGEESRRDEAFVRAFLARYCPEVELVVGSGDVSREAAQRKTGIEETAREMRYAFLRTSAQDLGAQIIATAHNADDNAETLLLHLIRGTGLRGLTAIPPCRDGLIRPLLTTPRSAIEEYLRLHDLPHVEDSSNCDTRYTRNRVRHQLLPLLEELNPGFTARITDTIRTLREDEDVLCQQARQALSGAQYGPDWACADVAALMQVPPAVGVRAVRMMLGHLAHGNDNCTAAHLRAVLSLCSGDSPSASADLPNGITARRVYDRLELTCSEPAQTPESVPLPLPGELSLPGLHITARRELYGGEDHSPMSFCLSCRQTQDGILLRSRRTGDSITRPGRPSRSLKKLMIDEKIPRHLRHTLPVLTCADRIVGVIGVGPDAAFLPRSGEECWHILCRAEDL